MSENKIKWLNRFVALLAVIAVALVGTKVLTGVWDKVALGLSAVFTAASVKIAEWLPSTKKDPVVKEDAKPNA